VGAALVLTFSLLPALLVQMPASWVARTPGTETWSRLLRRLPGLSRRHPGAILAVSALLAVLGGVGFARLRVDSSFEDLYGEDSAVVRWARFTGEHLSPPDRLEIDLALPKDLGIGSPEVQQAVTRTAERIEAGGSLEAPRSLFSRPYWRQELLAASAGRTRSLDPWVDLGERHVRVSFATEKLPQDLMRDVMAHARSALDDLPAGFSGVATGPFAVVHDMVDAIRSAQLSSFGTAAVAITLLLWVYLGSLSWALLAMLPTLLPVVVTLGMMGLFGIALDIGSAMVAAVVLGIAVDDSIHLLDRFRRERRSGAGPAEAIERAIRAVGQPLISTSVALAFGFSALALSPWHTVASFGLVSGVAILSALAAVLLVLPALVCAMAGDKPPLAARPMVRPLEGRQP
jgi:predicted RND superfamily exporter protein